MDIRGVYMFSSLMKQNKKAKICFVICFAGKKKLLFYIYAVIVKQKIYKRSSNYYWSRRNLHAIVDKASCARASVLERQSLCLVCESVIRLANKTSVSTEINRPRIFHASALVPVCESRVDRGQRGFSALAWYAKECDPASG